VMYTGINLVHGLFTLDLKNHHIVKGQVPAPLSIRFDFLCTYRGK
jgi:hypothetical protein